LVDYAPNGFLSNGDLATGNSGNGFEFDGSAPLGSLCGKPTNAVGWSGLSGGIFFNGNAANSNGGNGFVFSDLSGVLFSAISAVYPNPPQATIGYPEANNNGLDGFQFINVSGVSGGTGPAAQSNGRYGFEIRGSCLNSFNGVSASSNGSSGIYLGCVDEPYGKCSVPGTSNQLAGAQANNNDASGIEVEKGENGDQFYGNSGSGNKVDDAIDHNPNCGTNLWFANSFTNGTPPCVNNLGPL
jgi:hypothetical protein